tara:strand:- start:5911 stop:6075 length:165 start_codon:yes stop_codon:yes gene_type:complete
MIRRLLNVCVCVICFCIGVVAGYAIRPATDERLEVILRSRVEKMIQERIEEVTP